MKHYILGAGNLGRDLLLEINARSFGKVNLVSRSKGSTLLSEEDFEIPKDADVIWYCVGGGSVEEVKKNQKLSELLNRNLPLAMIRNLIQKNNRKTKLVIFSTDYIADEECPSDFTAEVKTPRSLYAQHKLEFEHRALGVNRGNVAIVRVGSLYGVHKPEKTFPGKILANFGFGDMHSRIRLPSNLVTPTPTRWLAGMLIRHIDKLFHEKCTLVHHCAPNGNISVHDWAKYVLDGLREPGEFYDVGSPFFDEERPHISNLKCNFSDENYHWHDLWSLYFKKEWFFARADSAVHQSVG